MAYAKLLGERGVRTTATTSILLVVFGDVNAGKASAPPPWRTFQIYSKPDMLPVSVAEYDPKRGVLQSTQAPTAKLVRECRRLFKTDCRTPPEIKEERLPPSVLLFLREAFGGRKVNVVLRKPDESVLSYLMVNGRVGLTARSA